MYTDVLFLSVSLSSLYNLFAYWLKAAKKGKKVNDSLPCLFLSLFSRCRSSLYETFFRSQIVFFNIDQMFSLFSLSSSTSLSVSLSFSLQMCSIFFSSLHAPRLMFVVVVQLTLLDRETTTVVIEEEE